MINHNYFFWIFLSTIVAARIFLFLKPTPSPTIKGVRLHHWMYGVGISIIAGVVNNITLLSIGLGLFVDELTFLLMGGKNHEDNYSAISLIGTVGWVAVVFFVRERILQFFL